MSAIWEPPVGVLITRDVMCEHSRVTEFCYREAGRRVGLVVIARIKNWRAEPHHGAYLDCAKGQVCDHYGTAIVRRTADEDDVDALCKLWASSASIEVWAKSVALMGGLCEESKAMIARVIAARGER